MEGKNGIKFELLGSFSYGKAGTSLNVGKKTLSFLQYLIVNHERSISSEELIERFLSENDSTAPGGALRHMLFKIRNLLEEMFPEQEELLLTLQGCYAWNPAVSLELDAEQFEAACLEAGKLKGGGASEEERYRLLVQAISLYKGDFLLGNDSDWALVLRQHYQTLYLDACKEVLPLLHKKEQWMEILNICGQAYIIDFAIEEFTLYQMRALIALGQPAQAIQKYEAFRDKMLGEFEMLPTEQAINLYTLAAGLLKRDKAAQDIFKLVCGSDTEQQGAFFCTFEMFQSITALEKRHLARSGQTSALVIVSLSPGTALAPDSRRLKKILLEGLRAGDPVARLEANSYILLLSGANVENARTVMSRLENSFHRTYQHSKASITYRIAPLILEK